MNLPDVLENLNDPELGGGVAFKVKRTTNTRSMGNEDGGNRDLRGI